MSLFRREQRQVFPEPIIGPFPGTSVFGQGMGGNPSIDSAMQVSAVWACVRLLADAVSMMPVHAFTMKGETRTPIPDPPILKAPAQDDPLTDWLYMLVVSLMLRGNAYGRIVGTDGMGYPSQIEWMHPDKVTVRTSTTTGRLEYVVNGLPLDPSTIKHVRAFRMPGSRLGLSPIQFAARTISTDAAVAQFASDYFANGAHPSSVLSTDTPMTQDQARSVKARFLEAVRGREPAVLSGGLKYQAIQVTPDESQFLATQKYGVAAIARIFGVPPEMIAAESGNSMTYANVEQRSIDFLTYSVQPWLTRIEAFLGSCLPGTKHVRFDTSSLLRTDLETRMKATAIAIASHQMLPNEARKMGDLPPFTAAEKAEADLVPMTVTPSGLPKALPGSAPAGEGTNPATPAPTTTPAVPAATAPKGAAK